MDESILCPGCQARLMLPVHSTEQTLQCPRCRNVFELTRQRTVAAGASARQILIDKEQSHDEAEGLDEAGDTPVWRLTRPERMRGEWKAIAAMLFLVLSILSFGLQGYIQFEQIELIQDDERKILMGFFRFERMNQREADLLRRRDNLEGLQSYSFLLLNATCWPAMVFFLVWLQQAIRNLRAEGLLYTRGYPALSFFIPLVNLYRPYCVMQEVWRASHPLAIQNPRSWMETPRSFAIRFWWCSYLACWIVPITWMFIEAEFFRKDGGIDFRDELVRLRVGCLQIFLAVIAGMFLVFIIHSITKRQRERYIRLHEDPA